MRAQERVRELENQSGCVDNVGARDRLGKVGLVVPFWVFLPRAFFVGHYLGTYVPTTGLPVVRTN